MAHEIDHDFDSVPESVGMLVIRCPDCGGIHIGMMDDDQEPICELTLDDEGVIRMAAQLLQAVYPSIDVDVLVEKIKAASTPMH